MKKMLLNQFSKKVTITPENLFLALYISLVSAYVLIRAFSVSVVHDEAITYFISLNNFSTLFNLPYLRS
jgi:predicted secreted protein